MAETREYAFDVKMGVVCRVKAESEEQARAAISDIDAEDLNVWITADGSHAADAHITEGSVDEIVGLFEVDGKNVEVKSGEQKLP